MEVKIDIHDIYVGKRCVRSKQSGAVTTQDFLHDMQQSTTVTKADGMAVLTHLRQYIMKRLSEGQTVTLDDIGTFSLSYQLKRSARGKDTSNLTANDVEMKRIVFKSVPALRQDIAERLTLHRTHKGQRQAERTRLTPDKRRDVAIRLAAEKDRFMAEEYASAASISIGQAYRDLARFVADGVLAVSNIHRYKMYGAGSYDNSAS